MVKPCGINSIAITVDAVCSYQEHEVDELRDARIIYLLPACYPTAEITELERYRGCRGRDGTGRILMRSSISLYTEVGKKAS
jgi:hypothetical protein